MWGTLLAILLHAILLLALVIIATHWRNLPGAEEWLLVPSLTGREPTPQSLWEPSVEHRVPRRSA